MNKNTKLNKNKLVEWLNKPAKEFTKDDIISYITENDIQMVNFMYPAADGRLKTLNFVINDLHYLETILTLGERVDGSSLFPFISAGSSDLYVLPRYRTAFLDPFAEIPTVTMLCSFFDKDGNPLSSSPEQTLKKACKAFTDKTGLKFQAMGELEYYVIQPQSEQFPAIDQKGYHESAPFAKTNDFRTKCMLAIAQIGGHIKYGHSEVGNFSQDGLNYEQNEIEFLPIDAEDAADELLLAKWAIRNLAYREGVNVTFAPKITTGKAGSGLHVHMKFVDATTGKNMMLNEKQELSEIALKGIAGLMLMAPSLTAFGNKNPTSYFRLVPHQEAPTNVCWGDRNRSVLVRVPLGWNVKKDMSAILNGDNNSTTNSNANSDEKQTIEIRNADCTADIYQLLAGIAVAIRHGFERSDALDIAKKTYVDVNIHTSENAKKLKNLKSLPTNTLESAEELEQNRMIYEKDNIFEPGMIDNIINQLKSFDITEAQEALKNTELMKKLVDRYFHCG